MFSASDLDRFSAKWVRAFHPDIAAALRIEAP